ncbi:MAG: hypothetical protein DKM50_01360 [Candidatus Margulisiibacteriota bacterium]|nr:MAG: hypothetical protein DKM50_01360 [Candidatus Margulisiibacteriota bacterium]HCY36763.1 hypothetical protein [Candidatus Margulisiibacteriota bacterium]
MPTYKYIAMSTGGKKEGVIDAPSTSRVAEKLKELSLYPISITEVKASILRQDINHIFEIITIKDILFFTMNLRVLIKAGLTITDSLDTIQQHVSKRKMKLLIEEVKNSVANGQNLSEALQNHPRQFTTIYTNMIKAGEDGGILIDILKRLVALMEYESEVKDKIKKATRYPLIVIFSLGIASIILTLFIFPKFMKMFSAHGGQLPLPTKIMIAINTYVGHHWLIMILTITITIYALRKYVRTYQGKQQWDSLVLLIPIFGPLTKRLILSRLTKILAMLIQSGLPILNSVEAVINTTGNSIIVRELYEIREKIRSGHGISKPMRESKVFPELVANMIAVGEKTGNITEMLLNVSEYYEEEASVTLDNLAVLLEPILIIFLSAIVLFVILAVYLPILNMTSLIR